MIHKSKISKIGIGIFILLLLVGFLGFFQPNAQASVDCPTGTYMNIKTGDWEDEVGDPLSEEESLACEDMSGTSNHEFYMTFVIYAMFAVFILYGLVTLVSIVIAIVHTIKQHQNDSSKMGMWLAIHICGFIFSGLSVLTLGIHFIVTGHKKWGIILFILFGVSILSLIVLWILMFMSGIFAY